MTVLTRVNKRFKTSLRYERVAPKPWTSRYLNVQGILILNPRVHTCEHDIKSDLFRDSTAHNSSGTFNSHGTTILL